MDQDLREALAEAEERHWWFEGRRRIVASFLSQIEPAGPILEVGCGNGANLPLLSTFGAVTAIEPDPADRARAQQRGCAVVLDGSLPDSLPVAPGTFRAVLALDVIEHIQDDRAALRGLSRQLAPGGTLIVTVPANPWMWSDHDARNGHYRRYTVESLEAALRAAGLTTDRISHFNSLLLPIVAFVRVAGRAIGVDGAGTGVPTPPLNWMLMKLLASESRLLRRFDLPVGVSLIALAHRDRLE